MNRSEIQRVLESCELFTGLDETDIRKIASLCQVEAYEPGEDVFRQGDFGDNLFIIAEGHIFLERSTDLGNRKGNVVIGILGRGRAFGCWSNMLGEPHNLMSSASCQKPTRLVVISGTALREMMINNKGLGFDVLERLCFLLRDRIQAALGAMEKV